jgi:hypothetical protein
MGMDKRALWSKILATVALMLMAVGFVLITVVGRRAGFWALMVLGFIVAAAGAILSKSSSRKLVLWGAGGTAATMAFGIVAGVISGLRGKIETPDLHPVIIAIIVLVGTLGQITIVVGIIGILLEEKRPASPPMSRGTGEDLTEATPADPGSLHSAAEIKRISRKKGLVWGAVLVAVPLLVIGIFLLTRGGEKTDEPQKLYAEGQYFTVGSAREEVMRIQGPPTFKLEMVWFYGDSQVQFDSDGKVTYIWDDSKNLKFKPEKLP